MKNIAQSVVLYGPAGCGKSTNAQRISKALNLPRIVEFDEIRNDARKQRALPEFGVLLITHVPDEVKANFRRLSYDHAMTAVAIHEQMHGGAA
jgi:hypothetical protein